MTTTVTFDNPALADAVRKANMIAPNKGAAFDKAAGILVSVNPSEAFAYVRATDTEVTYEQRIPIAGGKGDPIAWRIPSSILNGIVTNLPMDNGAQVSFLDRDDSSVVRLQMDKMLTKLHTLNAEEFPRFVPFDSEGMSPAADLAAKVERVSWACAPKSPVLSGIYIDGNKIVGCDGYSVAFVPCVVEVDQPVTVPLAPISAMLKAATDVRIRANDKRFEMMLDPETKMSTSILEGKYPGVDALLREDWLGTIHVHKTQFLETLNRMMVMVQNEKAPTLTLEIEADGLVKMLTFDLDIPKTGRMRDSIDVSSDSFDGRFTVNFVPKMLVAAAEHVKGDYFDFSFGVASDPSKFSSVRFMDEGGYTCLLMPKKTDA